MSFPTHLITGLILGKLTGNYTLSLSGAILVDLDHLYSYAKSGVLFKSKKFWQTITDQADPYGDQRSILHNVFVFILISGIVAAINLKIGLILGLAYLSHLILDALDNADYWPFFPNKKVNLRGPVGYFSKQEVFLMLVLSVVYLVL
jgi:membrane-bound metal-dependent hydrolase YbcI (DUF457 family)